MFFSNPTAMKPEITNTVRTKPSSSALRASIGVSMTLAALSWASSASATLLVYEPFDYERRQGYVSTTITGEGIQGLNGGVGFSGAWFKNVEGSLNSGIPEGADDYAPNLGWGTGVGARSAPLAYTDAVGNSLVTSGNQMRSSFGTNSFDRRKLAQPIGDFGSTIWISYLAQSHGATTDASRYAFVEVSNNGGNRIWLGKSQNILTGNWGIQLPDRTAAAGGVVNGFDFGNDYKMNLQTMFVMKLDFPETADGFTGISVWLNPANLTDESALGTPVYQSILNYSQFDELTLRGRYSTDFDELRLGTTFDSVTPVPEPSTYALLMGLAVAGMLVARRRFFNRS
jgi:hypothetical protein